VFSLGINPCVVVEINHVTVNIVIKITFHICATLIEKWENFVGNFVRTFNSFLDDFEIELRTSIVLRVVQVQFILAGPMSIW